MHIIYTNVKHKHNPKVVPKWQIKLDTGTTHRHTGVIFVILVYNTPKRLIAVKKLYLNAVICEKNKT